MARWQRLWLCVVAVCLMATPAAAQRSFAIQQFDAEISVESNGAINVVETIRPRFTGRWNGIYRTIPVEYGTPQGFNYTLLLDSVSITDERGQRLKYESSRVRHYRKFKIWVPGAEDATRTVVIRYRVRNGLKFFDEHDELYWNVTGDEWEVPIESVTARIRLPERAAGLRAVAFTGGYGSRDTDVEVTLEPAGITIRSLRQLNFKEGLTVVVGWNPGVVARPTRLQQAAWFLRGNFALFVPPVALVLMWRHWLRRGRDPRRRPIVPSYAPPASLSPAELGTLIDNSVDMRDVTATIVDLAVRGFLLIEERSESHWFGLVSGREYVFSLRKPRADWANLKPHEQWLLEAMFRESGTGAASETSPSEQSTVETVTLSQLENRFYKDLPELRTRVYQQLVQRGYYSRRPDRVKTAYVIAGAIIGSVVAAGGAVVSVLLGMQPFASMIAGALTAVIVIGFGWFMPARTEKGARVLEEGLGFEEFLNRVESDRFSRVIKTPEMFETFLSYAMALGVEKAWARAFADICKQPPEWYRGSAAAAFSPHLFVGSLNRMSSQTASAMASAPRSSGGSGFSGGHSGGGFGGGGGGGF